MFELRTVVNLSQEIIPESLQEVWRRERKQAYPELVAEDLMDAIEDGEVSVEEGDIEFLLRVVKRKSRWSRDGLILLGLLGEAGDEFAVSVLLRLQSFFRGRESENIELWKQLCASYFKARAYAALPYLREVYRASGDTEVKAEVRQVWYLFTTALWEKVQEDRQCSCRTPLDRQRALNRIAVLRAIGADNSGMPYLA